jgi:pimeloyl-ACP methyl ester carboxylesterase
VDRWRDFPKQLSAATGLGALAYSRLGYGRSDPVPLPRPLRYTHDEARLLPEVLKALNVEEAILIGHSDGGSIAIICTGSGACSASVRALILEAPHVFAEEVGLRTIARIREEFVAGNLAAKLAKYHGDNLQGAFWGWNKAWLDPDFRTWNLEEYLPAIRVPILLIQGEDDPYGTLKQVEAIQGQAGGPVEVRLLSECGHSPHRDCPVEVLAAMVNFTSRTVA